MTRSRRRQYRRTGPPMLRATVNCRGLEVPAWPAPGATTDQWRLWLGPVWGDEEFQRTISSASPDLARQVDAILSGRQMETRRARRAALAVARYAIRYAHRSTPFGLFAGVALAEFGERAKVRFGQAHEIVDRHDPAWLDSLVRAGEADPAVLADVEVCVNTLARIDGGRVRIPAEGTAEFSMPLTAAVGLVVEVASSPISYPALLGKLAADFPTTSEADRAGLVAELLRVGLLRSGLRAPATVVDPASVLPAAVVADADVLGGADRRFTDVRLDALVRLPESVAVEVETAATVLARLSTCPQGTGPWRRYLEAFADRFGEGVEVSLLQLTDPDTGLGMPDGFGAASEPPRPMSRRDRLLLDLAGGAALEGRREVVLSEAVIEELEAAAGGPPTARAPHFEVCAQVDAPSIPALDRGDFRLRVHTVSRAAGTMTGRFWHLFPGAADGHTSLPTVTAGARPAQLSFHSSRLAADLLTRAPQVLGDVVSVGEFRGSDEKVLRPADLAVGMENGHLYLVVAETGVRLELLVPTAINFVWNNFTPPLVRFLAELSRASVPQMTWFDWGAAWTLPFTPAVRYRRSVLVAARWQLRERTLASSSSRIGRRTPLSEWAAHLHAWRRRARVPERVLLALDDQHLLLDLSQDLGMDLLRTHLGRYPVAVLHEAPPPDANGWIGGRAHSIVQAVEALP
ncbi:lantibiotic dehydratase family protein [Actinocorallia sp. API 0066]|uniref:lantibiotic dehydratase family protein n=1 Tax=Actinocorallia sp. API 0066 TaxID=2896846 RepID=UPI001E4833F2|nr:lantibiotic dehydratase family protein [Actinocorallia sp. API 0066]MCD0451365.1 lantibiotic dehydratase family protein [Actinocorallia sp. API 0066]